MGIASVAPAVASLTSYNTPWYGRCINTCSNNETKIRIRFRRANPGDKTSPSSQQILGSSFPHQKRDHRGPRGKPRPQLAALYHHGNNTRSQLGQWPFLSKHTSLSLSPDLLLFVWRNFWQLYDLLNINCCDKSNHFITILVLSLNGCKSHGLFVAVFNAQFMTIDEVLFIVSPSVV